MDEASKTTNMPGFWRRTLKRLLLSIAVMIPLAAVGVGYAWFWFEKNVLSTLPSDLSAFKDYRPPTSCRVYASSGEKVDEFYLERRIWVPLTELADTTWQAFIAAEDRRFLEHKGVDPIGIARAFWVNFRQGGSRQGGSTITQQIVKNLIVGKDRSYIRKLREATLAYRLEKELSKDEILELYINYVALGSGNYGVEAAAHDYFGVSARAIDAGQAALLAGLVPAPSRYSPRVSPEIAARRRELVLHAMVERGFLDPARATEFLTDPVLIPKEARRGLATGTAYATEVRRELRRVIGQELSSADGLQIQTALDLKVQRVAEDAVRDALHALEGRQGRMGATSRIPPEKWESFLANTPGIARPGPVPLIYPSGGDCFKALVGPDRDLSKLRAGRWLFDLTEEDRNVRVRSTGESDVKVTLKASIRPGDVLRVCLDREPRKVEVPVYPALAPSPRKPPNPPEQPARVRLDPRPWAEGAAVVIENATGRVLALVGGYDVSIEGFVRATQARRQPGSSFKPYVYTTALLAGKNQLDQVIDAPLNLPAGGGKRWTPKNYDGKFHGAIQLRRALALSLNTVAVRIALDEGPDAIAKTAFDLGIKTPLRKDPTIALGSSEVTPMEHAIGYATIARMGVRVDPVLIERVRDVHGREIGQAGGFLKLSAEGVWRLPGGAGPRVIPAGVAYEMVDMMREVVRAGTARSASKPGFDRAGKTGTTNGFVDAWFVGFTPRYTVAVWVGTDGTDTLGDKETGGRTALPAWIKIIEALPNVEGERFAVPDEAMFVPAADGTWVGIPRATLPKALLGPADTDVGEAPLMPFQDTSRLDRRALLTSSVHTSTPAAHAGTLDSTLSSSTAEAGW